MQILKEKFENEKEFRKEEMELKKKEQENKAAQHQMLIDQQRQNQQQYQDVMKMMAEQQQSLGFWIPRHGSRITGTRFQSLSVELGFSIPIASGSLDSLSCTPDSKAQDSGFLMQIFPRFQIPLHGAV